MEFESLAFWVFILVDSNIPRHRVMLIPWPLNLQH